MKGNEKQVNVGPMDIRRLRYFIAVARLGSFSRAASRLRVAQSALSRHVKKIEEELGTTLLVRDQRGLKLTEAGALLLHEGEALAQQLRQLKERVVSQASQPTGQLRIGTNQGPGEELLPAVLARFKDLHPNVSLHVKAGFSGYVEDLLHSDQIDVGIMHRPRAAANLLSEPIAIGKMAVILPPPSKQSDILTRAEYSLADLSRLPLIAAARPNAQRVLIEEAARAHGIVPNVVLEVDNISIIKAMVREGLGCTVIAYTGMSHEVKSGTLRAVPLRSPAIEWTMSVVTRTDRYASAAVRAFVPLIKLQVRRLLESGAWPAEYFRLPGPDHFGTNCID